MPSSAKRPLLVQAVLPAPAVFRYARLGRFWYIGAPVPW